MKKRMVQGLSAIPVIMAVVLCLSTAVWPATVEEKMKLVEDAFSSSYSEEMYYRTDRLLVSATGSRKPVYRAPAVATVIAAEDIEAMGATSLDEILETVPGLHISPSSLNRLCSVYSIRGIHTKFNPQVLLLVDGVPVTQLWSGGRPVLFKMPVSAISRVEVIRGPGSAIYGADAFAGTINVITKEGYEVDGTETGVRLGSFDSADAWLTHGAFYRGWDVFLNLEYQESGGDPDRIIAQDLQSALDGMFGTQAALTPGPLSTGYRIMDAHMGLSRSNWTVRLWTWLLDDAGNGSGGSQALDPAGKQDACQLFGDVIYHNDELLDDWDVTFRLNHLYRSEDSFFRLFPPGSMLPIGPDGNIDFNPASSLITFPEGVLAEPDDKDYQTRMDVTALYYGFSEQVWRFSTGMSYLAEETWEYKNFGPGVIDGTQPVVYGTLTDVSGTPFVYMEDQSRTIWHVSVQDEWQFARNWELTAGVRLDHYTDFGDTVNPRIALIWEPRYDVTTKFLYGQAFRPPSFAELYARNNPVNLGNTDLDPETIRTWEWVLDYQPVSSFNVIFNVFAYTIEDLIEQVKDPGATTSTAQNAVDQTGRGFELEAAWSVTDSFGVKGNIAVQRSKNRDTGERIPDAPGIQGYVNAHWNFLPDWSFDAQLNWVGDRRRAKDDPRPEIDDYTLVDMTLRRKHIAGHWDIALLVRNVFDEDAREPSSTSIPDDFPLPGRSLYGEVRFTY